GVLGLVTDNEDAAAQAREAVRSALHCQRHRGPDEIGTWAHAEVVLGFNRLSFIDAANSRQPLTWGPAESPQRYTIIFNGEIYNFRELREELTHQHGAQFHTTGDTETIVAAYHHLDRKSTRLNSSHVSISYAVFCLKKKIVSYV